MEGSAERVLVPDLRLEEHGGEVLLGKLTRPHTIVPVQNHVHLDSYEEMNNSLSIICPVLKLIVAVYNIS